MKTPEKSRFGKLVAYMVDADVPHWCLGAAYQNQKQALREIGLCQVFFLPATRRNPAAGRR